MPSAPSHATPAGSSAGRSGRRLWPAFLLVLLAALALQWTWVAARESRQPTGEAAWIWMNHVNRWSGPKTGWAMRDFELETVPAGATVTVLGDEEYVLYLNGERVGSNRYTPEAKPDRYEVGPLLVAGRNRLAAELRSSRGFGAFLLTLSVAGGEEPLVVTDASWQISPRYFKRLFRPDLDFEGRFPAVVVGRPPFGRWGSTAGAVPRPLHSAVRLASRPLLPARIFYYPERGWRRLTHRTGRGRLDLPGRVLLDWGDVVDGYLTLSKPEEQPLRGLAYLGLVRPDPAANPPDAWILGVEDQPYWEDSVPRRFRFALLVGLQGVSDVRVVLTDREAIDPVVAGTRMTGVLGRPAPRLASPLEDEIWRQLESLPSGSERQIR